MRKKCTTLLFSLSLMMIGYAQNVSLSNDSLFYKNLSDAAIELTKVSVEYDPSYFIISYPNGDIPSHLGVNADVIIRAYRKVGVDLQKEVHEDILKNEEAYPFSLWNQTEPDTNIDHRRVPNLQVFFTRNGDVLSIDENNDTYKEGDIVIWEMDNNKLHIGIVTDRKSAYGTPLVVHNSASGQRLQNVLFHFQIIGHYRYSGARKNIEIRTKPIDSVKDIIVE